MGKHVNNMYGFKCTHYGMLFQYPIEPIVQSHLKTVIVQK